MRFLCGPLRVKSVIPPSPVGLLQLSPISLQSQTLWGLILQVSDPWAGEPDVGLRNLTPVRLPLQYNYSPVRGDGI